MPASKSGRRPLTCHHEAGHALARWLFGYATRRVVVQPHAAFLAGVRIRDGEGNVLHCEGMVDGYEISAHPYGLAVTPGEQGLEDEVLARRVAREVDLILCCSGYVAEARYRRWSPGACAFSGGCDDLADFRRILDAAGLDDAEREEAERLAEPRAIAVVRSPRGWRAVTAMAKVLQDRGELDGGGVDLLCREAYGGWRPTVQAWMERWPPSPDDLRTGLGSPSDNQASKGPARSGAEARGSGEDPGGPERSDAISEAFRPPAGINARG